MKISKLFHWLYGLVMLLPIFAIGVTCAVTTFNMSAKNEANYKVTYKYETNEVTSIDDLIDGNIYHLSFNNQNRPTNTERLYVYEVYNLSFDSWTPYGTTTVSSLPNFAFTSNNTFYYFYVNDGRYYGYQNIGSFECDFVYRSGGNYSDISSISICANVPILSVEELPLLEDVFYRSVDKVTQSNVFNWAYDSFLVAPFSYIVALFSMPSNSPVVMLMSYWLAISIIWLVFDLVMYVPLLVHRWLDKGGIE